MTQKTYRPPQLTEYGRIEQLTLGQTGGSPDFATVSMTLINNDCNPGVSHPGLTCS